PLIRPERGSSSRLHEMKPTRPATISSLRRPEYLIQALSNGQAAEQPWPNSQAATSSDNSKT
ncbi:hypothetical protein BX616_009969, partial [Lobosporangium transversale]